ncbi:MAG: lipid-A-disaccharide synthase, partial [Nitrospirota bacterium]
MSSPPNILLVCAEASGDLHGGHLVEAARDTVPGAGWFGCGGDHLDAAGMELIHHVREMSVLGLADVIRSYPRLRRIFYDLVDAARARKPDLAVLIDSPDFNLRLARPLHRLGIPILYYVSPQVWAWKRGRIPKIARLVDRLMCILPFEPELYAGTGLAVDYIGHPLADEVRVNRTRAATLAEYGLDPDKPTIALLPGSRRHEVAYLLPVFVETARRLQRDLPDCQYLLSRAPTIAPALVDDILVQLPGPAALIAGRIHDAVAASDLVWVASGTASLEVALLRRPMVILYKAGWLTAAIAKRVVTIPHLGMVNILGRREVVPELIQENVTPERLLASSLPVLTDPAIAARQVAEIDAVVSDLDRGGASKRAAEIVAEMLAGRAS